MKLRKKFHHLSQSKTRNNYKIMNMLINTKMHKTSKIWMNNLMIIKSLIQMFQIKMIKSMKNLKHCLNKLVKLKRDLILLTQRLKDKEINARHTLKTWEISLLIKLMMELKETFKMICC